jgi:hypothetical protein
MTYSSAYAPSAPPLPTGRERGEGVRADVLTHGLRRGLNYAAHYVG